jgi:hypothetical protein
VLYSLFDDVQEWFRRRRHVEESDDRAIGEAATV